MKRKISDTGVEWLQWIIICSGPVGWRGFGGARAHTPHSLEQTHLIVEERRGEWPQTGLEGCVRLIVRVRMGVQHVQYVHYTADSNNQLIIERWSFESAV